MGETRRRWAHAFPPKPIPAEPFGSLWKSLCMTACLPLVTDYLPSEGMHERVECACSFDIGEVFCILARFIEIERNRYGERERREGAMEGMERLYDFIYSQICFIRNLFVTVDLERTHGVHVYHIIFIGSWDDRSSSEGTLEANLWSRACADEYFEMD